MDSVLFSSTNLGGSRCWPAVGCIPMKLKLGSNLTQTVVVVLFCLLGLTKNGRLTVFGWPGAMTKEEGPVLKNKE